ncbi:MAG: GNAT family N-acetyltransferase [Reyranella sp.]|uniref:GNAT family N-acetyltransferase n=1 Tax=Reyranella sp. TaxID=1929291 RepID=UPI0027307906|nr:GNAT family N-acetyltransferase [Reyranella sp.]MDP1961267.1 GNAT family N-acetyltransferase [Reyranella sp.]MDP2374285.1 GNAT family N-acetyltransferase [Reyranella sp.]
MHLPDLPPDIQFHALPKDEQALGFSFEAKRAAMGPYIVQRWGWDEALQMRLHRERFGEKPFFKVVQDDRVIGTVSVMPLADHVRFGEFYLFPEFQRHGLGGAILRHCLALADAQGLPVRLEYLKWNPVGTLYRRHGFAVIGETKVHWLMERAVAKPST